jgi:hypothetical protein
MNLVFSLLASLILSMNISTNVPYSAIERAFESNNAKGVVTLGKSKLLINVLGKEGAYSQSQAKLILQDFMSKNNCTSFEFIFKGKESSDGSFAIANYTSRSNKFRVTIYFKKEQGVYKIENLNIEKD